jgi:hypothetical protein
MYQRLRNQPLGVPQNLEDGNASTNVSINDNDMDGFNEGVSDEHQAKKCLGTKRKINCQEEVYRVEREGQNSKVFIVQTTCFGLSSGPSSGLKNT